MKILILDISEGYNKYNLYISDLVKALKASTITRKVEYDLVLVNYLLPVKNAFYIIQETIVEKITIDGVNRVKEFAKGFIVHSEYTKQQLLNHFDDINIIVIPNYVNENIYKYTTKKIMNSILYVGRIHKNNREYWLPLIKAMDSLPMFNLTVAGKVTDNLIYDYVKNSRINNINVIGEVENDKKIQLMKDFEFGVSHGRTAKEMLLSGMSVILNGKGYGGWITNDNIEINLRDNFSGLHILPKENVNELIVSDMNNPQNIDKKIVINYLSLNRNKDQYLNLVGEQNDRN